MIKKVQKISKFNSIISKAAMKYYWVKTFRKLLCYRQYYYKMAGTEIKTLKGNIVSTKKPRKLVYREKKLELP